MTAGYIVIYVGCLVALHLFFAAFTIVAIKDSESFFAKVGYLTLFAFATWLLSLPFIP